jgi:hypothetical protein
MTGVASSLPKATRAIDLYQRDSLNESALKDLIRAAVACNTKKKK